MSTVLVAIIIAALSVSSPLPAQQWSAEQQEVVTHLKECWDIWEEGIETGSPDQWLGRCTTEGYKFWGDAAPGGVDVERRAWPFWMEQEWKWVSLTPIDIIVHGDFAVMHFFGGWQEKTSAGWVLRDAKRTEVFRNINGRWRLLAGHLTLIE